MNDRFMKTSCLWLRQRECSRSPHTHFAAEYPARPIRFIVPFPPGGGVDVVARTAGEKLGVRLAQTIVIDNRPGAGAALGASLAAKSAPDGYTLLVGPVIGLAIVQAYYLKLDYDLARISRRSPRSASGRSSWSCRRASRWGR